MADNSKSIIPGPGAYFSEKVTLNSPKIQEIAIAHSPRKPIFNESDAPPPGTYNITSTIGKASGISISKVKYKEYGDKVEVGPGSYDLGNGQFTKRSMPSISFSSKQDELKQPKIPGPGDYDISESFVKNNHNKSTLNSSLSTSTFKIRSSDLSLTPGPGDYDILSHNSPKNHSISTFGKGRRQFFLSNDIPGPGTFQITSQKQQFSQKNFTLGSKIPIKNSFSEYVPGPGAYNLPSSFNKPSIKIGGSKRNGFPSSITPGPGAYIQDSYNIENSFTLSPKDRGLGYSRRPNLVKIEDFPGPGNYHLPSLVGQNNGGKISEAVISDKWKLKADIPGPGAYDISNTQKGQKGVKFQSKNDNSFISNNYVPGPGKYDAQSSILNGPKFSFPQTKRQKEDMRSLFDPAPGQYEMESCFAVPSYLQSHRKQENNEKKQLV